MKRKLISELNGLIDEKVCVQGWVYKIRRLKFITFVIIRDRTGLVQCIVDNNKFDISEIAIESVVSIIGKVKESNNKLNPFEVEVEGIEVISKVKDELPIEVNKENLEVNLEENLLKYIIETLKISGKEYLELLQVELPAINNKIPRIKFEEAINILKENYNKNDLEGDLDPEAEKLLCKYVKENLNSDFVFLTNYPRKKRPMYTMPLGEEGTHSFDLLFKGIEITTGGQRIHDYKMLVENMKCKGLNPNNYDNYLEIFKYGMPRHGGLAIRLERITAKLLGLENVREATLITRDRKRLIP